MSDLDDFAVVKLCQGVGGGHGDTEFNYSAPGMMTVWLLMALSIPSVFFSGVSCFVLLVKAIRRARPFF
ncbi:MAG: hypothetical protein SPK00_04670 [Corynebacterium glucuronolyticum]|nr:hypothetical protein [Corynebacterium glucuronolyticum]